MAIGTILIGLTIVIIVVAFLVFFGIIENPVQSFYPPKPKTKTSVKPKACIEYGKVKTVMTIPEDKLKGFLDNDWSVMFWIKMNTLTPKNTIIMKKGTGGSPSIHYNKERNFIQFEFTTTDGKLKTQDNLNDIIPGEWKHFAWVQRGNRFEIYEDGLLYIVNDNLTTVLSPGDLEFTNLNGDANILAVTICQESVPPLEVSAIYEQEKPDSTGTETMENRYNRFDRIKQAHLDAVRNSRIGGPRLI